MKKIVDRRTCESLIALADMGKVRMVKEYVNGDPEIFVYSASGRLIGPVGRRWQYLFEEALIKHGSGDGLLEDCNQTTVPMP